MAMSVTTNGGKLISGEVFNILCSGMASAPDPDTFTIQELDDGVPATMLSPEVVVFNNLDGTYTLQGVMPPLPVTGVNTHLRFSDPDPAVNLTHTMTVTSLLGVEEADTPVIYAPLPGYGFVTLRADAEIYMFTPWGATSSADLIGIQLAFHKLKGAFDEQGNYRFYSLEDQNAWAIPPDGVAHAFVIHNKENLSSTLYVSSPGQAAGSANETAPVTSTVVVTCVGQAAGSANETATLPNPGEVLSVGQAAGSANETAPVTATSVVTSAGQAAGSANATPSIGSTPIVGSLGQVSPNANESPIIISVVVVSVPGQAAGSANATPVIGAFSTLLIRDGTPRIAAASVPGGAVRSLRPSTLLGTVKLGSDNGFRLKTFSQEGTDFTPQRLSSVNRVRVLLGGAEIFDGASGSEVVLGPDNLVTLSLGALLQTLEFLPGTYACRIEFYDGSQELPWVVGAVDACYIQVKL